MTLLVDSNKIFKIPPLMEDRFYKNNNNNNTNNNNNNNGPIKSHYMQYFSNNRSPYYQSPPPNHPQLSPPTSPYLYNSPPPQHNYYYDYEQPQIHQPPPSYHPYYSPKYSRTPPPPPPGFYNQSYIDYFPNINSYPPSDLIPQPPPQNIHMFYQNVPNSPPLPYYQPMYNHEKYLDPNFEFHQKISQNPQNLYQISTQNPNNPNINNSNNGNNFINQNSNNGVSSNLKPIQPYQPIKPENPCNIGKRCILCLRGPPEILNSQTWSNIMRIVLYVLHECCNDQSNSNFFQLKKDVYKFMVCHWHLICSEKNKTENWHKQIQDILSHSKDLFESGMEKFQQNGFWKLKDLTDPWTLQKPFSNRGGKRDRQSKPQSKNSVKESCTENTNNSSKNIINNNNKNNNKTGNEIILSSLLKGFNTFKPQCIVPPKSPDSLSKGL